MKIFIPLLTLVLILAGCAQIQMSDPKMSVGLASSKKPLVPPSKDSSAELKARYVSPRALSDFTKALTVEGRDWHKHGVYIETLEGGEPVAMMNEDTPFNPASVIKLATTLAALNKLGPNHRFHTDLLANGEINEKTGELNGDLILFSGRDPSFSISDAKRAGESLRKFSVRRVNGSLVVIGDFNCNNNSQTGVSAEVFEHNCGMTFRDPIKYENYNSQPRGRLLVTVESDTLLRIVQYQNAHSVNSMAETLADHIGGPQYVKNFLVEQAGLSPDAVKISTGSGLNVNRMSPRDTVRMLRAMVNWLDKYSLKPDAVMGMGGIDPGTMRARFAERGFAGSIIAKTGTLTTTDSGMANLAGIMRTRNRGTLLFAVYDNAESRRIVPLRRAQDEFLKELMNELGGPAPEKERSLTSNGDRLQSRMILAE
ncbi:MAG TPA: D-alanyl-D-alanine carboxypeptidase [Blastocatellia bacterium]|nr:D-alanyl-D-alanine carboxypeptidase [Blastocatellia bacterium]